MPIDRQHFIKTFYGISDTPTSEAEDAYVNVFTSGATMIMGTKKALGKDEIRRIRQGMWAAVQSRHHVVSKIYPAADEDELMLFGSVEYGLKDDRKVNSEWAARMVFDGEKLQFYQVWLDPSQLLVATGKKIEGDEEGNVVIV